eukprot:2405840-Rhodomonas_salina.1
MKPLVVDHPSHHALKLLHCGLVLVRDRVPEGRVLCRGVDLVCLRGSILLSPLCGTPHCARERHCGPANHQTAPPL